MPRHEERFKPFLFADQTLDELIDSMAPKGGVLADARGLLLGGDAAAAEVALVSTMVAHPEETTSWHRFLLGACQLRRGQAEAGVRTLRALIDTTVESRVRLWTWGVLRGAGVTPDDPDQVLGVVIEVHVDEGVDTLAAYADGTARYLLHTGAKVIWDKPDDRLADTIGRIIAAAQAATPHVPPGKLPDEPAPLVARHTLLTSGGVRAIDEPLAEAASGNSPRGALFGAATELLEKILAIVKW